MAVLAFVSGARVRSDAPKWLRYRGFDGVWFLLNEGMRDVVGILMPSGRGDGLMLATVLDREALRGRKRKDRGIAYRSRKHSRRRMTA